MRPLCVHTQQKKLDRERRKILLLSTEYFGVNETSPISLVNGYYELLPDALVPRTTRKEQGGQDFHDSY